MRCLFAQVRMQLDPIWNTVSRKTRQIVRDLQTLRQLAGHLYRHDAVTFLGRVSRFFVCYCSLYTVSRLLGRLSVFSDFFQICHCTASMI